MKLIFFTTDTDLDKVSKFYKDMMNVANEQNEGHFLNDYIWGPKKYNPNHLVTFNHFGTRIVGGYNSPQYGIRLRGSGKYLKEENYLNAFNEFLEKVTKTYDLKYVMVVEDERNDVYINTDKEHRFFGPEEGVRPIQK